MNNAMVRLLILVGLMSGLWLGQAHACTTEQVLSQQFGNPLYTQAAAVSTNYTAFTYTVPGNTIGTCGVADIWIHGAYLNSVSADTPIFTVKYGAGQIAGTTVTSSQPANANERAWVLHCRLASAGVSTTENGYCTFQISSAVAQGSWNTNSAQSMTENNALSVDSTVDQALTLTYNDGSSGNSTVKVYSAVVEAE